MKTIKYFIERMREPSTLAGLGVLATLAGMPPDTVSAAAQVLGGLAALFAVVRADR